MASLERLALALQLGAKRVEEARGRRGAVEKPVPRSPASTGRSALQVIGQRDLVSEG